MARRQFSREFKLEAVRLVKERGVSVVQASRDLDVGENVLRRWIKKLTADPGQAFPGQGRVKPEQQEIDRNRCEWAISRHWLVMADTDAEATGRVVQWIAVGIKAVIKAGTRVSRIVGLR